MPIDQTAWPPDGKKRDWLVYCDRIHRNNGLRSLSTLAQAMKMTSRSRISQILRGLGQPADEGQARELLMALGAEDSEVNRGIRIYRATYVESAVQGRDVAPVHGPTAKVAGQAALGRLIRNLDQDDALDLEVHQAVTVADRAVPVLPPYLPRAHDERLRSELAQAINHSRLIMLVGGSSTGKTRACWEAIRAVLPHWRVWHPLTPERPDALVEVLAHGTVAPQTVIWLNEAQMYLQPAGIGSRVATAIQQLLRDPDSRPVIVLGSMWPNYWKTLRDPFSTQHEAARELLMHSRDVAVPAWFTNDELASFSDQISADPRLSIAAKYGGGRITQHLAGAPELVRRYQQASEHAKAVVWAAMDARRLSRWLFLPKEFFRQALPGYLDPQVWDQTPDDDGWFDQILKDLIETYHGAPGILSKPRPLPDETPAQVEAYRLADYLAQVGRQERDRGCPPGTFWSAAAKFCDQPDVLNDLAQAAEARGRLRRAKQLYERAGFLGNTDALQRLSRWWEDRGDLVGAEQWALRAASYGSWDAVWRLVELYEMAGDRAEAERLVQLAASRGHTEVLWRLLARRPRPTDRASVKFLLEEAAKHEDVKALHALATLRDQSGNSSGARDLLIKAAGLGDLTALWRLAKDCDDIGDSDGAQRFLREAANHGDLDALRELIERCDDADDAEGAERFLREAIDHGDLDALRDLAKRLVEAGDATAAEELALHGARLGDTETLLELAQRLEAAGDSIGAARLAGHAAALTAEVQYRERVQHLVREAAEQGDEFALWELIDERETAGDHAGAERLVREAAERGDTSVWWLLVEHRFASGDGTGAERLAREAVDRGDIEMLSSLSDRWRNLGGNEGAQRLLDAASRGDTIALREIAQQRETVGDHIGAEDLARKAADLGDTFALWEMAEWRANNGDDEASDHFLEEAASRGDAEALWELAERRDGAGDRAGAERLAHKAADLGDIYGLRELARRWTTAGERASAERLLREAVDRGHPGALSELAQWLQDTGDYTGARNLLRYGMTDKGTIFEDHG